MKGSILDMSEMFMKIISTASVAIVLLAIFFTINQYHLIYLENRVDRETLAVGNTVLSSCIVEADSRGYPIRGLLSKDNIEAILAQPNPKGQNLPCLRYNKAIYIEVYRDGVLLYGLGDSSACSNSNSVKTVPNTICEKKFIATFTTFPGTLNRGTDIIPVNVKILIGTDSISPIPYCGNGLLNSGEQCDDGNIKDDDGCSMRCVIEPGCKCTGTPSVCDCCGNKKCETTETCTSCPGDCGQCISCKCSPWASRGCYNLASPTCPAGNRRQTRTCFPVGCTPADDLGIERCTPDNNCCGGTKETCSTSGSCTGSGGTVINKAGCIPGNACCKVV